MGCRKRYRLIEGHRVPVTEFVSGSVYIREMRFEKAGEVVDGHAHNFDHTTYLPRGAFRIEQLTDDDEVIRAVEKRASESHNWVLIRAGARHRITAIPHVPDVGNKMLQAGLEADADARSLSPEERVRRIFVAMTSVETTLGHCIYSHRTPQGEVVHDYDGWPSAYV